MHPTVFFTTKDSSVGRSPIAGSGLGDVCSCVFSVTIVNEAGDIRQYNLFDSDGNFDLAFQGLLDSQGTQGIAVRILLAVRKKTPVTINTFFTKRKDGDSKEIAKTIFNKWKNANSKEGNVFAAIGCGAGLWWMEERIPTSFVKDQPAPFTWLLNPIFLILKKYVIERCHLLFPLVWLSRLSGSMWLRLKLESRPAGFHYTREIGLEERKLSYSYCAFPITSFDDVVAEGLEVVAAYKEKHNFEPEGLAVYFVEQSGLRLAGPYHRAKIEPEDSHTFVFDPVFANPNDEEWHKFLDCFHGWLQSKGGRPSLTQSFRLEKQDLAWGGTAAHGEPSPRFTNSWLQQFFDAKETNR